MSEIAESSPDRLVQAILDAARKLCLRRHPDLFSPEEAASYLCLASVESLRTLRDKFGLQAIEGVRPPIYHREDLDRCVLRMRGIDPDATREISKPLRLSGPKRRSM